MSFKKHKLLNYNISHPLNYQCVAHPDVGVDLLLKASNLSKMLPHCLLEMQDAAALLFWVT